MSTITKLDNKARDDFANFYHKYEKYMYAVARVYSFNREEAEDAVHDTFLRMAKHVDWLRSQPEEKVRPYLVASTINRCITRNKRNGRVAMVKSWITASSTI